MIQIQENHTKSQNQAKKSKDVIIYVTGDVSSDVMSNISRKLGAKIYSCKREIMNEVIIDKSISLLFLKQ
jgi:CheY-specific phosphatase CheX